MSFPSEILLFILIFCIETKAMSKAKYLEKRVDINDKTMREILAAEYDEDLPHPPGTGVAGVHI